MDIRIKKSPDGNESLVLGDGFVTYEVNCDGRSVTLHDSGGDGDVDEVIVREGERDLRFYKLKGGSIAQAERLFTDPAGKTSDGAVDEELKKADQALIASARLMYEEALKNPERFESESFEKMGLD